MFLDYGYFKPAQLRRKAHDGVRHRNQIDTRWNRPADGHAKADRRSLIFLGAESSSKCTTINVLSMGVYGGEVNLFGCQEAEFFTGSCIEVFGDGVEFGL